MKMRYIVALSLALLSAGVASAQSAQGHCAPGYSDCVLMSDAFALMPEGLKAVKKDFAIRLSVASPIVETPDGYYFGSGGAAHEGGLNEAAWVINKITGKSGAIIMRYIPANAAMPAHENFELYGTILAPLMDWAVERGMTEGNVVQEQEPVTMALPAAPGRPTQ